MENTKGLDNFINSTLGLGHGYLAKMLELEEERQDRNIELIASENYASEAVRLAMASCLTNKYAEGYSGNRFYGGCEYIDKIEDCCKQTWQRVFNTDYSVNVQPHSGTQANLAVYNALINPGDTILSLDLNSGGHLSHGSIANFSGKIYDVHHYNLDKQGYIDTVDIVKCLKEFNPKLVIAGASAYPRQIYFSNIKDILEIYARNESIEKPYFMVDMAHIAGLVAAGVHPSPFGYADVVTTTTHKTLRGPRGGLIFCRPELEKKINSGVFPGTQGGPLEHVILAKAICAEEALRPSFKEYIEQVVSNAKEMADTFVELGYDVVTGGTDTHLFLIDFSKTHPELTGRAVQEELDKHNITLNKNCVPNEKRSPYITSGVRIGTPAMTTRGWKEADFQKCALKIDSIIKNLTNK